MYAFRAPAQGRPRSLTLLASSDWPCTGQADTRSRIGPRPRKLGRRRANLGHCRARQSFPSNDLASGESDDEGYACATGPVLSVWRLWRLEPTPMEGKAQALHFGVHRRDRHVRNGVGTL
jgi:hypothetical protein